MGGRIVVITCSHVVEGTHTDDVRLVLPVIGDGEIEARIIAICPDFDVAALEVVDMTEELRAVVRPLQLVDSADSIELGSSLTACGYPLGQSGLKVSDGVFSGWEEDMLQHSVPISQGNSGGPLLLGRKVVGINSSGIQEGSNIGYAIPIDRWSLVVDRFMTADEGSRVVRRPLLGFCYHKSERVESKEGVVAYFIVHGGPMHRAGVRPGDVITDVGILWRTSGSDSSALCASIADDRSRATCRRAAWYDVNARGEVQMGHSVQRVSLDVLLSKAPFDEPIYLRIARGKGEDSILAVEREDCLRGSLRTHHSPLESPLSEHYLTYYGLCVMQLCENHHTVPRLALACERLSRVQRQRERLIVTFVFPGTVAYEQETVFPGSFILTLNGRRAANLKEFREAARHPEEDGNGRRVHLLRLKGGKIFTVDAAKSLLEETKAQERGVYIPDEEILNNLRT